jgi:hypothetical protein
VDYGCANDPSLDKATGRKSSADHNRHNQEKDGKLRWALDIGGAICVF